MKLYSPSKIQRRLGERLFLKPERDLTPKSAMVKRPYPPGVHGRTASRSSGDYATILRAKQKVRFTYVIPDAMLRRYVRRALSAQNPADRLFELLESRLDAVVFRLGLSSSRLEARHLVSYGHVAVNGSPVRSPSRFLRPGDRVAIREASASRPMFAERKIRLKGYETAEWLRLDRETFSGELVRPPKLADGATRTDFDQVLAYYSR